MLKIADVVEEIALEGSDAITIECLFERLNLSRSSSNLPPLPTAFCQKIWLLLTRDQELTFHDLGYERFLPQFQARKNCSNQDQLQEANVPDEMDCERDPYPIPRVPFQRNLTEEVINIIKTSFFKFFFNK